MFEFEKYILNFFKYEIDKNLKKNWVDVAEQMMVHTRKKKPTQLLTDARPNEEEKITKYRIANYRPITYGVVNSSFDDVFRAVGGINYSIENASEQTKEFIGQNNFDNYNLETYLQKKVLRRDIEDPNGFLVWLPSGDGLFEENKSPTAKPVLVYSEKLYYTDFENVFSYLSDETNKIKVGATEIDGKVYYILTKTDFYKYIQVDSVEGEKAYRLDPVYEHNIGEFPVIIMGGDINDDNFFNSFFSGFLAFGDECLRQFSDWQATMVTCGFPIKEKFMQDCEIKVHINRQSNPIPEDEEKFKEVVKSKGENTMHETPLGMVLRQIPSKNSAMDDTLAAEIPSVRFIAPPVEVAIESKASWIELRKMAKEDLQQSLSFAGDSGKKVELTNEGKYSMLTKICNNYFDNIYRKSLIYIEAYLTRKAADSIKISINKPSTFSVQTETDIVNEMTKLKTENAPTMFIAELTKDLAKKRFSGNPLAQKMFEITTIVDPLFTYTVAEKTQMQLSNNITPEAFVLSVNAYGALNKIAFEMSPDAFIKSSNEAIIAKFNEEIKNYMPKPAMALTGDNGE